MLWVQVPLKIFIKTMFFLKKNWLVYRKFINLLDTTTDELNLFINNFKFEIKLYLIGLSFNRFVFNYDKIFFILCVITNFLFFLAIQNPRVAFIGEKNKLLKHIFHTISRDYNQLLYYNEKYPLPGLVTNITQAKIFCFEHSVVTFIKHLDCIFSFFCLPNSNVLAEAQHFGIPIIGLVDFECKNINPITYPIICGNTLENSYFFASYFSKILNYKNWNFKIRKFKNLKWYNPKDAVKTGNKHYSLFFKSIKDLNLQILYVKLFLINFKWELFFINLYLFPIFNSFFFYLPLSFINYLSVLYSNLQNILDYKKDITKNKSVVSSSLQVFFKKINEKIGTSNYKLRMLTGWRDSRILYRSNPNSKRNLLKKAEFEKKKDNFNKKVALLNSERKELLNKISQTEISSEKNSYLNSVKLCDIKLKHLRSNFKKDSTWSWLAVANRPNTIRNQPRENTNSWSYRKMMLFTTTLIPKKRKRIKRLRFARILKKLFKRNKSWTPRRYLYNKRPKKMMLKKKIAIKKMMFYFYNYPLNKQISKLMKYCKKEKHKISVNSTLNLINVFECKLCIFITRIRFASNVHKSKELITKGNILVNGLVIYRPDYILNIGDIIALRQAKYEDFYKEFLKFKKPRRKKKRKFFNKLRYNNKVTIKVKAYKDLLFIQKYKKFKIFRLFKFYWQKKKFFTDYKTQIMGVENFLQLKI